MCCPYHICGPKISWLVLVGEQTNTSALLQGLEPESNCDPHTERIISEDCLARVFLLRLRTHFPCVSPCLVAVQVLCWFQFQGLLQYLSAKSASANWGFLQLLLAAEVHHSVALLCPRIGCLEVHETESFCTNFPWSASLCLRALRLEDQSDLV